MLKHLSFSFLLLLLMASPSHAFMHHVKGYFKCTAYSCSFETGFKKCLAHFKGDRLKAAKKHPKCFEARFKFVDDDTNCLKMDPTSLKKIQKDMDAFLKAHHHKAKKVEKELIRKACLIESTGCFKHEKEGEFLNCLTEKKYHNSECNADMHESVADEAGRYTAQLLQLYARTQRADFDTLKKMNISHGCVGEMMRQQCGWKSHEEQCPKNKTHWKACYRALLVYNLHNLKSRIKHTNRGAIAGAKEILDSEHCYGIKHVFTIERESNGYTESAELAKRGQGTFTTSEWKPRD